MRSNQYLWGAVFALLCAGLPLRADINGADPRLSGAPGDQTCTSCHGGGRANVGSGGVQIAFASGSTYVPGEKQRVTVTVSDPTARIWGFETSPRLTSSPTAGAGTMATVDSNTQLARGSSATLQWLTHTRTGNRSGTANGVTFQFDWTPPSTNAGNVDFYVAANAGNNNNRDDAGDNIYTTKATLTPASSNANKPAISQGGAINAFSNLTTRLAPGTWVSLFGTNLANQERVWADADFNGNNGPTSLGGVSVTVNGKAAPLNYISPGQINIQIPMDAGTGTSNIVVTGPGGTSDAFSVNLSQFGPSLLAPAAWNVNGKQYVVAQFPDGTYVGPPGLIAGLNFRPAAAGDTIIIYGLGFGPLQAAVPAGQKVAGANPTASPVTFQFSSISVAPAYAGGAPGFVGTYQLNVVVPASLGSGDVKVDASVGGISTGQTLYITVQ